MKIKRGKNFWNASGAATAGLLACALATGRAQTADILLQTGGTGTPISETRLIDAVMSPTAYVKFDFGFATAEELFSTQFLDSVTFTLQGSAPAATTILGTVDRSAALFAPLTPGGISLDPSSITVTPIAFAAGVGSGFAFRQAYSVTAAIPQELLGQNLTFFVDLFDNKNGVDSLAYATAPTVIVPEPTTALLAFVGFLFLFGFKWRNK